MRGVSEGLLRLVGNTPLVTLKRVASGGDARVLGKLESLNPSGSVKDRVALAMVEEAETRGILRPGGGIVEASSGNTGVALAMVAAAKGYSLIVFMPENAPAERRRLLARYGAEVRLTPSFLGMDGSQQGARALSASDGRYIALDVFRSPAAVRTHRETTANEIIEATGGRVDAFVVGVGTGATISGVGERLKEVNPSAMVVAVEPASSPFLTQGRAGPHAIPGLGADFVPPLLNRDIIDHTMTVTDDEAAQMSLRLARDEGLLVGISSGANVVASLEVARRLGPGRTVVTVLPDTGERYLNFPI